MFLTISLFLVIDDNTTKQAIINGIESYLLGCNAKARSKDANLKYAMIQIAMFFFE